MASEPVHAKKGDNDVPLRLRAGLGHSPIPRNRPLLPAAEITDNPCMPISTLCRPRSGDAPRMLRPRDGPRPSAGATAPSRAHTVEYWRPPRTQITPAACQIASNAGFSLYCPRGGKGVFAGPT